MWKSFKKFFNLFLPKKEINLLDSPHFKMPKEYKDEPVVLQIKRKRNQTKRM
jgi:hypothetical protein